jgi:NADPH:quinone reductase-like Zn-dependent oxidoreductase
MRAVRFERFGGPEQLGVRELAEPSPAAGEALVRIVAAGVNPSDVKNLAGAMAQTTLPRTPGRDYAGVVQAGPEEWVGAEVWGSGDAGFTRDGTHATAIVVPVASLRRKPGNLSFEQAACVGVNYLAAWRGLVQRAALCQGETLVIIGAGGGVGGAAAQIAKRIGARVIGVDRIPPHPAAAILDCADRLIIGASDVTGAVRAALGGSGADVVFDAVGGVMFRAAVECLAPRGRLVEISATGQRDVSFNLTEFYHNESSLFGVDTLKLSLVDAAGVLEALRPGFEAGAYKPAPISRAYAMEDVAEVLKMEP